MADRRPFAAVAACLLLTGCTSFADTATDRSATAPSAEPTAAPEPPAVGAEGCPDQRAEPDPDRPVVEVEFEVADDLASVTGSQTVRFTPDVATDELVFRLLPNSPDAVPANELTVVSATGDDVAGSGYESLGAAEPGGLYVVELGDELEPGESTEVTLDFAITLGGGTFDRFGTDDGVAWWASAAPLLAWEPGVGWARDPFVDLTGETASSPAADTTITVSAPADLTVLMTGDQAEPSGPADGRRTWTSREPVARDVAVAVGEFTTAERTTEGGVRVVAGALPGAEPDADELLDRTVQAIDDLEEFLGLFPYQTLTVAQLPDHGGGIEYPSMILQATPSIEVLVHEVAHMWFYGMVGNSQFRDPWLDEAFATWAEAVVNPRSRQQLDFAIGVRGDVGAAMDEYPNDRNYVARVYGKGGAALLQARDVAGPAAFEAAIRCYVDATAWSIATPDDVAAALADLPEALDVLVDAGALDQADLPE